MKILAISDVYRWDDQQKLLEETQPDVALLVGDLTDDGWVAYAREAIDEYYAVTKQTRPMVYDPEVMVMVIDVDDLYEKNDLFKGIYREKQRGHVDKFYRFLKYAGKKCKVLVVHGNHDLEEYYFPEKIDSIPGCKEISGKTVTVDGIRFLGLGYAETHCLRLLKPIINRLKGQIDVVLFHGENLRLISSLEPKLIIRGGYVSGKYSVNGIPSVWNSPGSCRCFYRRQ